MNLKHTTNERLIDLQRGFWNEDFIEEGDAVSFDPERQYISELNYDESLENSYMDEENQLSINNIVNHIKDGGDLPPLLVDKRNFLIDGYHRLLAFKKLNIKSVLVIRLNKEAKTL